MQKTKRKKPLAGFTLDADYSRIANISIARPRGAGAVSRWFQDFPTAEAWAMFIRY